MAFNRNPPPLDAERINKFRAELDVLIDARVAEIRKTCEGVPDGIVRRELTRGLGCQCSAVLEIMRQNDEQAARENAA
jgi:hypothetical protein